MTEPDQPTQTPNGGDPAQEAYRLLEAVRKSEKMLGTGALGGIFDTQTKLYHNLNRMCPNLAEALLRSVASTGASDGTIVMFSFQDPANRTQGVPEMQSASLCPQCKQAEQEYHEQLMDEGRALRAWRETH